MTIFISNGRRFCNYAIIGEYLDQINKFIMKAMAYTGKKKYLMRMVDIVKKLTCGQTVEKKSRFAAKLYVSSIARSFIDMNKI